jgi:hypothetical protein
MFRAEDRSVALHQRRVVLGEQKPRGGAMWIVGVGVFAALAIFVVVAGVSKIRRANRGE